MEQESRGFGLILKQRCNWVNCGLAVMAVASMIPAGCSAKHKAEMRQGTFTHVFTPQPPSFLTGPTALLLTNLGAYSARLEVQGDSSSGGQNNSYGQLLGEGSKLLYAPQLDENPDARRQPGGYTFIWDTTQSKGYVLSEALQGYAPVSAELHVTSLESVPGGSPAQRFSGHPCEPVTVIAQTADSTAAFDLFRATDLRGFPVRIQTRSNAIPVTISLSNVRFEPISPEVFMPPDGFTLYPNPQAMADELAARQHNLRRRSSPGGPPIQELERHY